MMLHDATEITI